jgi:Fe-S-cluster containining protein
LFSTGWQVRADDKIGADGDSLLSFKAMNDAISQLCPNCGLCCDSTLFADVELRAGDDAKRLEQLGLTLEKKGKNKLAFAQPCAGFDGRLCKIYQDRPKRCGLFECGLLKRVEAEEMTVKAALKKISDAKTRAGQVRELLRLMGQRNEQMPLTRRYAEAMSAPVDFSDEAGAERHGELMLAVNDLMNRLARDFLR